MLGRIVAVAAIAAGGVILSRQFKKTRGAGMSSTTETSIDVNVPVSTAYNQWTQFESFPQFMENVTEVRQLDDTHLHWRANVAGKEQEWDCEITEQIPDKRIAWRSVGGARNAGVVTFHKLADDKTRVMLQMDYEPQTVGEQVGDVMGAMKLQTKADLKRFKDMLESRGRETGAWRGTVSQH